MKKSSKLACLFSLWLLSGLFTIVSLNVTNWADNTWIKMDLSTFTKLQEETFHKARLKTLYLWNGEDVQDAAWMSATDKTLDFFKWLIVEKSLEERESKWDLIVVGGWKGNQINSTEGVSNSGIAWWDGNTISENNAAIGGGRENLVSWEKGVVAWWYNNEWKAGWVVLWWQGNKSEGVVLWWEGNEVGEYGLAMWKWAKWGEWTFVRNDGTYQWEDAKDYSALIWTKNWVLIGTDDLEPKQGVSLVVGWPIQIWTTQTNGIAWEIRSKDGCLYAFDWNKRHILGKNSTANKCNAYPTAKTCSFGRILLQEWDVVDAYSVVYHPSNGCETSKATVVCTNGDLVGWWQTNVYIYPSCINLSESPYYIPG